MRSPLRSFIRTLIFSHSRFIPSHVQYKRILLTGQLCLITFVVCIGYLVLDLTFGRHYAWPYQLTCALMALTSLMLNRNGKFSAAKLLLNLTVNLTVFLFASSEPLEVGLYMYFITGNLGAFVAFGYEDQKKSWFFVLLSTGLFFLSLFNPFQIIPIPDYTEEYIRLNVIINFIGASGASACIIYFMIDVHHKSETYLRKKEEQIQQKNAELTKLNHELDRFASTASHDMRAPLNSITGLTQLMDMTTDTNELREYTKMITTRVKDLNKFIHAISDYSRNSNVKVKPETILVKKLVRDALENLRFNPGSERLEVQLDIPENLEVTSDITRLQIILNNLLSNAVKYQDFQKEKSFLKVSVQKLTAKVVFSIEDNGIGIPEAHRSKIFEMYSRAHDHSEGYGLGLYLVKEAVEKLGGQILVESTEGIGSKFLVEIPR